ncbi:MAG: sulfatase-like hydrolase/transferase [Thermoanaerobaculia bacterium]
MGLPTPSFRPTTVAASWHLGQCPRAWLTAVVVLLSLSACQSPDRFEARLDLAKSLATADVHLEPTLLDLGTVEARAFLGSGWSWNERSGGTSFVWGTGEISQLHFFLSTARELDLEIRCFPCSFQGAPMQEIRPTLNGIPLEPLILAPKPQVYRIHVPADATRQGTNRLTLRYGYSHSPVTASGAGGRRSLAVGWDWIRFHLEPAAAESEVTASTVGISMPFGTGVDFYFEADRGDRLAFDEILVPGDSTPGVEIRLLTDDRDATALLDLHNSQRNVAIDLPISEKQAVRLSMRVAALAGDPDPILLLGPRIETSSTRKGAPEASAKAPASLPPAERPNVLVYVVDTMRADHLGLYGYPRSVSPEIDQFRDGAAVFDHAIAQTSWTKPAVASIFTGLRATAHGVNHRQHRLASRFRTMAELLSDASYRTVAFTTNAYFSADSGLQQGFDEFNLQPARADRVNQKSSTG